MKYIGPTLALFWFSATQLLAGSFVLESEKETHQLSTDQLKHLNDGIFGSQLIKDPHVTKAPIKFEGAYLDKLLTHFFGKKWTKNQLVVFEASDGYKVKIRSQLISQYQPLLATGIVGKDRFSFADEYQQGKVQELGPLYLVWNLEKYPKLQKEGSTQNWPYKVVKISLLKSAPEDQELVPNSKHPPSGQIHLGYKGFKNHCYTCHTLNAENPHGAPSAKVLFQMLKVRGLVWLEKYLQNPRAWTPSSSMPSLRLPRETIKNIRAYSIEQASK